jgi:hypothetical protein
MAWPAAGQQASVRWQPLPATQTTPAPTAPAVQWQPVAKPSRVTAGVRWEALPNPSPTSPGVAWQHLPPGAPDFVPMDPKVAAANVPLPPAPALQSLNRSIAFNDGTPGPDLAMKVPQGFRWSEQWFLDASVGGANTRPPNSSFWAWNNGDAGAELHLRLFQQQNWSFGVNATIRSVYQGTQFAGGSTQIGDGFATGFRVDYALSKTSGIALGAEQLIQYDSNNDSGRNLYLVGSKGWWLGSHAGQFPLLISTAGIGTGRLGDNPSLQFGCVAGIDASIDVQKSYPLCWSPIGSAAIVFNPSLSLFTEYNSLDWLTGISLNANNGFPMRLTWGVIFANKGTNYNYVGNDNLRWVFRASIGL